MGYSYNKTMFYININNGGKMKNIKTPKQKTMPLKTYRAIIQLHTIRTEIKNLKATEKQLVDDLKQYKSLCPISFHNGTKDTNLFVLDITEQTRNVFNQKLFKEQNNDLFYKYVNPQLVEIVKVDKRNQ